MSCACRVECDGPSRGAGETHVIVYCPMHEAASGMCAVLEAAERNLERARDSLFHDNEFDQDIVARNISPTLMRVRSILKFAEEG